jgi:DnaD/phage-associated family protein
MFKGFTDQETFTPLPNSFFRQLLKEIEDADELKVTLHALWCIGNMEGPLRVLREQDFAGLVPDPGPALEKAVARGTLLRGTHGTGTCYFLNSPRGRLAAGALEAGSLDPAALAASVPPPERPNIFKLYEENIGPLTPLIADALKDAEATYPPEWVAEALEIAVKKSKRNWQYVEAILRRWKEEGHAKKQAGRNAQEDGRRYTEGEYADYIEH